MWFWGIRQTSPCSNVFRFLSVTEAFEFWPNLLFDTPNFRRRLLFPQFQFRSAEQRRRVCVARVTFMRRTLRRPEVVYSRRWWSQNCIPTTIEASNAPEFDVGISSVNKLLKFMIICDSLSLLLSALLISVGRLSSSWVFDSSTIL